MSKATKCDRCGTFYEEEVGCLTVDAHVTSLINSRDDVRCTSWTDIDFCLTCSRKVLKAMHPSMDEVNKDGVYIP